MQFGLVYSRAAVLSCTFPIVYRGADQEERVIVYVGSGRRILFTFVLFSL